MGVRQTVRNHRGEDPFPGIQEGSPRKNSPSPYATMPPMITHEGKTPMWPSKGVHPHLLCRLSGSIRTACFGKRAKSPRHPGEKPAGGIPSIAAGLLLVLAITSGRLIFLSRTAPRRSGTMVSTPGTPGGASGNGSCFSFCVWGAWSEAMTSIRFHRDTRSFRSRSVRNGGFTL